MEYVKNKIDPAHEQLVKNLRTRRLIKQYTQEYLANLCDTTQTTIHRIEQGGNSTISIILKMCYHLNCLDEIMNATDPVNTPAILHQVMAHGVPKRARTQTQLEP